MPPSKLPHGKAVSPSFSIVTTVLNRVRMVGDAMASVQTQNYPSVEHIVADGGSTDGTLEILDSWPNLTLLRGPDGGPTDALNRGIAVATGDIVGFLMSDDLLAPGILRAVADAFAARPEPDVVSADAGFFSVDAAGRAMVVAQVVGPLARLTYQNVLLGSPIACARFYRRDLLEQIGPLDTRYEFCADRDLLLRALMRGVTAVQLDRPGYYYRQHPGSRTLAADRATKRRISFDHMTMARRHLAAPDVPPDARLWLGRLHAAESAKSILRSPSLSTAFPLLAQGFRVSPVFPAVALTGYLGLRARRNRETISPLPPPF